MHPGDEEKQRSTQRINITANIHRGAVRELLWAAETSGSHLPVISQERHSIECFSNFSRDPEVDELDAAIGADHDVGGFHIAIHHGWFALVQDRKSVV